MDRFSLDATLLDNPLAGAKIIEILCDSVGITSTDLLRSESAFRRYWCADAKSMREAAAPETRKQLDRIQAEYRKKGSLLRFRCGIK